MKRITLELSPDQAEALAQFCKRVTFSALKDHSKNEAEAYQALDAIERLRAALADSGVNPR